MTRHQIQIDGTDVSFAAAADESILDAAARNGIELPYSCRKGVCGNCRGQVLEGSLLAGTAGGSHETGIRAPNEHLFCRAQPVSDLVILPRSWHRIDPDARKTLQATVFRKQSMAGDVTLLHLRFATGVRARFAAGQYLQILLPDGQRRSFSMANPPHENDGVQLHIKHVAGGHFTGEILPLLNRGDVQQVELPHGDFWLREDSERPLLLVAGGTGFAPIKSIIDHMLKRNIHRPVTLFWGARNPAGLYAPEIIQRWLRVRPQLRYEPVISDRVEGSEWNGRRGLVHEALLSSYVHLAGHDVYVCGAPAMVQAVRSACVDERGLPSDQFYSDSFVSGPGS
nr:2Fe-2S iron-sulfur cluster-binding protein [Rhodoferax sp.]